MVKYKSVKSKSNIFKSLGLLALILFTFYFIYNYLATGSFSLKPRASEVVVNDVNSCSQLLTDVDCNRLNTRGCSWVVGPSTTKTENVPQVTTVPVTNKLQVDCTTANCTTGAHGCSFTETTTKTGTVNQPVYECDGFSGITQSKCTQLGGDWIQVGTKPVNVYKTTKTCDGSWENTVTTQQSVTTYTTKVVQVPGVGSCIGTLKPIAVAPTVKPPVTIFTPIPKPVADVMCDIYNFDCTPQIETQIFYEGSNKCVETKQTLNCTPDTIKCIFKSYPNKFCSETGCVFVSNKKKCNFSISAYFDRDGAICISDNDCSKIMKGSKCMGSLRNPYCQFLSY